MPKTKATSPARSEGGTTPKRKTTRGSRSLCSPALSTASGRLTSLIDQFKDQNMESFALSPLNGRSVLNDNTEIGEPRRKSWWKKLGENSQEVMEVLQDNKLIANNPIEELIDIEVLSQEKKNYTLDLPESSDNESIHSIVLPQRRLFTQKENQPQKKYGQLIDNRESLAKLHNANNTNIDKTVNVGTRELFQNAKRSKPMFPAALLNMSPNKTTADKTRENILADPKPQVRNIFGNRPANKRKNMFADFIVSESEDEIPDIQPKVFGFQKKIEQRRISSASRGREASPASSITTDIEMDFRMMLPSSTMVENQLEEMVASTPVKRARLSKLSEAKESEAGTKTDITADKTKQSNKSASSKNKSKASPEIIDKSLNSSRTTRSLLKNASKREENINTSLKEDAKGNKSKASPEIIDKSFNSSRTTRSLLKNASKREENINTSLKEDAKGNKSKSKITSRLNELDVSPSKSDTDEQNATLNQTKRKTRNSPKALDTDIELEENVGNVVNATNNATRVVNKSTNKILQNTTNKTFNEKERTVTIKGYDKVDETLTNDVEQNEEEDDENNFTLEYENDDEALDEAEVTTENEKNNTKKHTTVVLEKDTQQAEINRTNSNKSGLANQTVQKPAKIIEEYVESQTDRYSADDNVDGNQVPESAAIVQNQEDKDEEMIDQEINEEANNSDDKNEDMHQENEDDMNISQENEEANESEDNHDEVNVSQEDEDEPSENQEVANESEKDEDQANQSQEVEAGVNESQEVANKSVEDDDQANESQEVENECEIEDVNNESEKEQDEANESQEAENEEENESEDDEANQSQEVEVAINESQEAANESEKDEDQANQSQEVETGVNESQEVANKSVEDEDQANESQELEAEANASQEVEAEANTSQEVDAEANASQEVENESEEEKDEGNQSQEVELQVNESQEIADEAHESQDIEEEANESQIHEDVEACNQDDDEGMDEEEEKAANESQFNESSANESEVENDEEESHEVESDAEVNENEEVEDDEQVNDSDEADKAIATDAEISDQNDEMEVDNDEEESDAEENEQNEHVSYEESLIEEQNDIESSEEIVEESPNVTHDTTGRHRKKNLNKSPEMIRHDNTHQIDSFTAQGRNTSVRKSKSMIKNLNIKPSLAPPRDSTDFSDGTRNSSAEGSGWDSHRTTRKTLRQTFGKDFTPRKSLRALVMEKSAKRQIEHMEMHSETVKYPLANSTEMPVDSIHDVEDVVESDHEVSRNTRLTALEQYLQKIKAQNIEKRLKMEAAIRDSLKTPVTNSLSLFKIPSKPAPRRPKPTQSKPKKQIKSTTSIDELPPEIIEDLKYKPPKRFRPTNASWITKRLYKFLETKLEPKYDYKARVRAEQLVETLYSFVKELRRQQVASPDAVEVLKHEFARLNIVRTHFDFYNFFHEFMPREVRIKVNPDVVNKIALPRHGVFSDILR